MIDLLAHQRHVVLDLGRQVPAARHLVRHDAQGAERGAQSMGGACRQIAQADHVGVTCARRLRLRQRRLPWRWPRSGGR